MGQTREKKPKKIPMKYYTKKSTNNRVRRAQKKQSIPAFIKKGSTWTQTSHMVEPLKTCEASKSSED